jgi:hypothetical protein
MLLVLLRSAVHPLVLLPPSAPRGQTQYPPRFLNGLNASLPDEARSANRRSSHHTWIVKVELDRYYTFIILALLILLLSPVIPNTFQT